MRVGIHLPRRRFHRFIFCAAGIYNIAWGLYSVWDPQWLFRYSGLPLDNHPQIFACLGMVVGLYGIIYFEVARVPERGWLLAAVGLTGSAWPYRTIATDLEWYLAAVDYRPVTHERSYLVDPLHTLSLRCLAAVSRRCISNPRP